VQEDHGQSEHQDGTDDPVLNQGEAQNLPIAKNVSKFLVLHLRKRRVHHQDQADGDGDVRRSGLETVDEGLYSGDEVSQSYAHGHSKEYPEGQKTVEKGKPSGIAVSHFAIALVRYVLLLQRAG